MTTDLKKLIPVDSYVCIHYPEGQLVVFPNERRSEGRRQATITSAMHRLKGCHDSAS